MAWKRSRVQVPYGPPKQLLKPVLAGFNNLKDTIILSGDKSRKLWTILNILANIKQYFFVDKVLTKS